jgi:flavin reductase (DIM6/NTAB) family NADH-FMN oxidoreductase RutF
METTTFNRADLSDADKHFRTQFINSLPGLKPLVLVGTLHENGIPNLALFNSVVHIGADPPLLGMIVRPDTVARHTLENVKRQKKYSLNVVHKGIISQAHQTSARLPSDLSEFDDAGLQVQWRDGFAESPFVKECHIQIAMSLADIIRIPSNQTILVIGQIEQVWLPEEWIMSDGTVDHIQAHSAVSMGLNRYGTGEFAHYLPYAKPSSGV